MSITEKALGNVFRFSEKRWAVQFINGHFNFSCIGAYIKKAEIEGNNEQGDKYEAVFARLRKGDSRIKEYEEKLKGDLEIIDDGQYVLLRRHSAKYVPTFCFFVYKVCDLEKGEYTKPYGENGDLIDIELPFDSRMYDSFTKKHNTVNGNIEERITVALVELDPFLDNVYSFIKSPFGWSVGAKMDYIDYKVREADEFIIEPTDEYNELFYKRARFKYQHEARIVLRKQRFFSIYDRYDLYTKEFDERRCTLLDDRFKMCYTLRIAKDTM